MANVPSVPAIDPSRMSADDLYQYVYRLIEGGYAEISHYSYVMGDLLTQGVVQFQVDLARARAWNNRILGMLQEVRQVSSQVSRVTQGKARIFNNAQMSWLTTQRKSQALPKGMDAAERKALARLSCEQEEKETEKWDKLKLEIREYIACLKDKQSDFAEAKQDLRAQLWAVRVHGVLGELANDGKTGDLKRDPPMNGGHSELPPHHVSVDTPENPVLVNENISRLLDD